MALAGKFLVANITHKHDELVIVLLPRIDNVVIFSKDRKKNNIRVVASHLVSMSYAQVKRR